MNSPYKLRMTGEPPYSPAVPEPLPSASDLLNVAAVPSREVEFVAPEEVDILATLEDQQRADDANESPGNAFLAGWGAALIGVILGGGFAALTGGWHRAISIGIAFGVAMAVKHFGRGDDPRFGFIGAFWSLVGCVGAYYFGIAMILARHQGMPFFEYVQSIPNWSEWMTDSLGWGDLMFFGIAACCGFRFSYTALAGRY